MNYTKNPGWFISIVSAFTALVCYVVYLPITVEAIRTTNDNVQIALAPQTQPTTARVIELRGLPLPAGIPATTTVAANCFLPGEQEQYKKNIDQSRIKVSGCNVGVIAPQETLVAYNIYEPNTNGSDISCDLSRQNYFTSEYTNMYAKELQYMVDAHELKPVNPLEDSSSRESMCIANMIFTWADKKAMTKIGLENGSSPDQPRYIRYLTLAPISAIYFKYPAVRERASQMPYRTTSKDGAIKSWLATLSLEVNKEIEAERIKRLGQEKKFKTAGFYNLHFWSGFSILPTALLLAESTDPKQQQIARALLLQSRKVFGDAIFEIEFNRDEAGNGFLVRELQRRRLALSYQTYATYPILGMAALSRAYKCDFVTTSWKRKQLSRLVAKTLGGYYNPAIFINEMLNNPANYKDVTPVSLESLVRVDNSRLLYLMDVVVPDNGIRKYLSTLTNTPFPAGYGRNKANAQMGGNLTTLVNRAESLRNNPVPAAFSGLCVAQVTI